MKAGYRQGKILSNKKLASDIYELIVDRPHEDFLGSPGQFYMLRAWQGDPFLARPISIANIEDNRLVFLYQVKGRGTRIFSQLKTGDRLELLGPLGQGFEIEDQGIDGSSRLALVAGGIGLAPLVYLAKEIPGPLDFYCGFREEVYYKDIIESYVDQVYIATEDGSQGHKGFVTDLLKVENYQQIYGCGPEAMMKKLVNMAEGQTPVYISAERTMACGIGACLGCSLETQAGLVRVCKEGPVFPGKEVSF